MPTCCPYETLYGDADPRYHGSVVKALASAQQGHHAITAAVANLPSRPLDSAWAPSHVVEARALNPYLTALTVWAPLSAAQARAGHLFRLQPYATSTPTDPHTGLCWPPEGVALAVHDVDRAAGTLSFLVWPCGPSTRLLATLHPKTPLAVLGPVGCPVYAQPGETVLWVGGQPSPLWHSYCDQVGASLAVLDTYSTSIEAYLAGTILAGTTGLPLPSDVDRVIFMNSTSAMVTAWTALLGEHKSAFREDVVWMMAVTTPMQCMMQGVCGQCLQRHHKEAKAAASEETVEASSYIFACTQPLHNAQTLDVPFMSQRLATNRVQEQLFGAVQSGLRCCPS